MDPWAIAGAALVIVVTASFAWAFRHHGKRYWIRPMTKDAWGTRFEIISPENRVVGFDWYVNAKQRCASLNKTIP